MNKSNIDLKAIELFLKHYKHKRVYYWAMVFILPVLFSIAIFLFDIEARNLKSSCFPEQTFLACFNSRNIGYTLLGFILFPINLYPYFFIRLLSIVFIIEIMAGLYKRKRK